MNGRYILLGLSLALMAAGILGYAAMRRETRPRFDPPLETAIQAVQSLDSYAALVDTKTALSDRTIEVRGLYLLDYRAQAYASYATTTLSGVPGIDEKPSFSLANVAVGDDVYVKIDTASPVLKGQIPHSRQWRHFKKDAIPEPFREIAVAGPVLDNLALFREKGAYIEVQSSTSTTLRDEPVFMYSVVLSPKARSVRGGTLETLIRRIGAGTVEIYVSSSTLARTVVHGDNYVSTTTFLSFNSPLGIEAPRLNE